MNLVSIIIPCYNQAVYLSETLISIENQVYQNWECLIINDGSTDETETVARQFTEKDSRFIYIYQPNGGLSNARNTGISHARGKFIQFLDSDDLLTPNKLNASINHYNRNSEKSAKIIYYTSMRYFEDSDPNNLKIVGRDNFIAHVELKQTDSLTSQQEVIFLRNPFVISASLYPCELFQAINGFDEELKALEDWDFHIRCVKNGFKFHHLYEKEALTLIRLHNASMMRNQKLLDISFHQVMIKHRFSSPTEPNVSKASISQRIMLRLRNLYFKK